MIYISAGHHKYKQGACFEGFCEHEEAKLWAHSIFKYVGHEGVLVPYGVLRKKVQFINDSCGKSDIAVEVHFNSAVNGKGEHVGSGSETLYYPNSTKGRVIAEAIQEELGELLAPNRGAKEGYYQMNKEKGPDFFLARTLCTAIILEPEFIHRKEIIQREREKACAIISKVLLENSWED